MQWQTGNEINCSLHYTLYRMIYCREELAILYSFVFMWVMCIIFTLFWPQGGTIVLFLPPLSLTTKGMFYRFLIKYIYIFLSAIFLYMFLLSPVFPQHWSSVSQTRGIFIGLETRSVQLARIWSCKHLVYLYFSLTCSIPFTFPFTVWGQVWAFLFKK